MDVPARRYLLLFLKQLNNINLKNHHEQQKSVVDLFPVRRLCAGWRIAMVRKNELERLRT
jgi:hypothetical protein